MAVRQYIGSRYVPLFGRRGETSTEWDNSAPYEPLTVVTYQGNTYTSRQSVPAGIAITNTEYWIETGNYNAQIEQYRQEVLAFDGRITDNADAITELQGDLAAETENRTIAINDEVTARNLAIDSLADEIANSIRTYDLSNMLNVNSEINVTDPDSATCRE